MAESKTTTPSVKRETIIALIEKLEDLKKQATIERSHFYVNGICTEAISLLYNLLGYYYAEN